MSSRVIDSKDPHASWTRFTQTYQEEAGIAAAAIAAAWQSIEIRTAEVAEAARVLLPEPAPSDLAGLSDQLLGAGVALVTNPASAWIRRPPTATCSDALERFANVIETRLREVPASIPARDALALIEPGAHRLPFLRRPGVAYNLRAAARTAVIRQQVRLARSLDRIHRPFVLSAFRLLGPWRLWRRTRIRSLAGNAISDRLITAEFDKWEAERVRDERSVTALVEEFGSSLAKSLEEIQRQLARLPGHVPEERSHKHIKHVEDYRRKWSNESRSAISFLENMVTGVALAREATEATMRSAHLAIEENQQLKEELHGEVVRLQASLTPSSPPYTAVTPPEQHAENWALELETIARRRLPGDDQRSSRSGTSFFSSLLPSGDTRAIFVGVLADVKPLVVDAFRDVAIVNAAIARDIETVLEVTSFATETSSEGDPQSREVIDEAYTNSLGLLTQRESACDIDAAALEARLLFALNRLLGEVQSVRERGQFGVLAYSTTSVSHDKAAQLGRALMRLTRTASRAAVSTGQRARDALYQKIGLLPPRWEVARPVDVRSHLGSVLDVRRESTELPVIYRRLFRLEPVTDPRFLLGREEEMAAIRSAYDRWNAGQQAIVLIVGARGSGKTSLLNCAESAIFEEVPVLRLALAERLRKWEQAQSYLSSNLSLPIADLQQELNAERRVVVLEEFERCYLRVIGGFETARRLLDLIEATARNTMWILVVSRTALPILQTSLDLQRIVSVQINAMSLREETLRNVILQRHNLSGLRLHFEASAHTNPRTDRLSRFLGIEREPAHLFFESLYRESQGIFRAAFELWQGSIQRIEGGTLVMKQPLHPDYGPIRSEIGLEDTFAIHAIAQHGSLTPEELAEVLDLGAARSRRMLDRLQDMDVIEVEPTRPGFRIRPRALRLVAEILRNRNLV